MTCLRLKPGFVAGPAFLSTGPQKGVGRVSRLRYLAALAKHFSNAERWQSWSIASHSKCEVRVTVPGVRIPPSPPLIPTAGIFSRDPYRNAQFALRTGLLCVADHQDSRTAPETTQNSAPNSSEFSVRHFGGQDIRCEPSFSDASNAVATGIGSV